MLSNKINLSNEMRKSPYAKGGRFDCCANALSTEAVATRRFI